jgi:hypothetical protein
MVFPTLPEVGWSVLNKSQTSNFVDDGLSRLSRTGFLWLKFCSWKMQHCAGLLHVHDCVCSCSCRTKFNVSSTVTPLDVYLNFKSIRKRGTRGELDR